MSPSHLAETLIADNSKPQRHAPVLVEGSGLGLSDETNLLLAKRLRIASLLLSAGLFVFALERTLTISELSPTQWFVFGCHIVVTIVTAMIGWRLCTGCPLASANLRVVELIVFGSCWAFFAVVSYFALMDGASRGYVASTSPMWMTLMFTYALFIPNTWQRAAWAIGGMAVTAISILLWVRLTASGLDELISANSYIKQGIRDHVMVIGLAALISVWGVSTINSLRREAFEARRLGQYQLRHRLGAGGMGEVYLAEHMLLKRPCAIKVIREDRAGDATALARFEREVQATAQLTHWNTVEIFDYGRADDGTFYYVMEYLPGMNLDQLVRMHGPLNPSRIVHLLMQICDALREAHAHGLIHRDIKPANIFAAQRGGVYDVAKLLDFGLARPLASSGDVELTHEGTVTGSPLFMSPEQSQGDTPDERSDIYSLGAVAWFLAVGRPPFAHENLLKVMVAHANQHPERPSDLNAEIPADLSELIMSCLEKAPADRPQSAVALQQSLRALSDQAWSERDAAEWWKDHGCPKKRGLDQAVFAGEFTGWQCAEKTSESSVPVGV